MSNNRYRLGLVALVLGLAACGPLDSCNPTASSNPAGRFILKGSYSTVSGYTVTVTCDTQAGNLIYTEGNGGIYVVKDGCQ